MIEGRKKVAVALLLAFFVSFLMVEYWFLRRGVTMPKISKVGAMEIARQDAEKVYRDLSGFDVRVTLEDDGWHVEYDLKDPNLNGGGPYYVIDANSGLIKTKRYYQ